MSKNKRIDGIYKILPLFEDMSVSHDENMLNDYLAYLSRMYIRYLGYGNNEISELIKGLMFLKDEATQKEVHRVVFHIISLLEKGDSNYADKV